jgi:hypothetical protein
MPVMSSNLRRLVALGPILLALAAAPGCVTEPVVSLHHAEFRGASGFGVDLAIFLKVRNDNPYDVQIRNVHVNVVFGHGYVLGPIDFAPNQWLRSGQTTLVPVPVSIPWQLVPALAAETVGSYAIPYQVHGAADVTATSTFGFQRNNYPVDEAGSIPRAMVVDSARTALPIPLPL